ncbi:rab-GTPase-TBC domain-containing protein [Haematococcus lacustris]
MMMVDVEALRELSWMGIPHPLRPQCWRLLLGYCPPARVRQTATLTRKRTEYTDMLPQYYDIPAAERSEDEQAALRQVMVDVPRTAPAVPFFQEPQIQKSLERLLYIWGISGYVQGMNDLVTPFLAVFLAEHLPGSLDSWHAGQLTEDVVLSVEADCYWCLCKLVEGIQDHYTYAQPGIQRTVFQLQALAMEMEPELTRRLLAEKLDFIQFAWRWVNCLLVRELPFHLAFRLWDTYLSEGYRLDEYLVQVCAAFLAHWRSALLPLEFQEMIMFLQRLPTADWEEKELAGVLSQAHVYRLKQEEKAQAKGGQTRSPQPPAAGQPR